MLANLAPLQICYETALAATPDLGGGTLGASLLLLRSGSALNVDVSGFAPAVDGCVARELAHVAFPYLDAQTRVTIPITFGP